MGYRSTLLTLCLLTLGLAAGRTAPPAGEANKQGAEKPAFTQQVMPFLAKHCTSCHGGAKPKAGLALDQYKEEAAVLKDRKVWDKVLQNVRQEATDERQQTRGVLEFLGSQIRDSEQVASRFGIGMALRQEAIDDMNSALRDTGANGNVYATLFVADTLARLVALHGGDISDKLLQELARKEIQPLAPDGKVFRWSPTSVLLLWRSEKSHEQLRDAANTAKSLFEHQAFVSNRLVTFKVAVRSILLPVRGALDDILSNLDNFAS